MMHPKNEQPCWTCAKAYGDCEWSRKLEPVSGWEATPTVKCGKSAPIHSYKITYCPKYEREN